MHVAFLLSFLGEEIFLNILNFFGKLTSNTKHV